jgi:serine phosphatase RsbU (regulator of sigma subunit)/pSer/pThr/pTyr-binding forkhead associated (FHA) protein
MQILEIVDASGKRRKVELSRPRLLIGREPTCDICLPHPSVSRRHAQLQQSDHGLWLLQDLNSLNHVYVDTRPVQHILLEPGIVVRIADYRLSLLPTVAAEDTDRKTLPLDDSSGVWSMLDTSWLEHMQEFQRALLRIEDPRQVLERLAQEVKQMTHPEIVAVALSVGEEVEWQTVLGAKEGSSPEPSGPELMQRLMAEDSEVKTWMPESGPNDTPRPCVPTCLLFPMKGRGTILGHLYLQRPRHSPLPPSMLQYLALLTTQAGLVTENLQLAELRVEKRVFEQEQRRARQIQVELFPATTDVDLRLDAYAVNLPSVLVSGDYYDLVRTGPDTVAFVVADAMGHGMPAALMMAPVRASLHMGLTLGLPWKDVFRGLDDLITQTRAGGAFVSGLLGQIDFVTRRLDIVSAGHPLPSVLVGGKQVTLPESCQTRPWGLDFDSPWQVGHIPLGDADWSILCFTDGISESATDSGGIFSYSRVLDYHRIHHALNAEDLCQGLISEVAERQQIDSLSDDQTVLVLRSAKANGRRSMPTRKMTMDP